MVFPRTKFNRPISYFLASQIPEVRTEIIEPTLGFDKSQPPTDLKPGQTPNSNNFVVEDGYLTPRSGLSVFGPSNTSIADAVLLLTEHQDVDGNRYPIAVSAKTANAFLSNSWSTLSYVVRYSGAAADALSGTSLDEVFGTSIYEPGTDQNWFVFSNAVNTPKVWIPSDTTYSDLSDFISVESTGRVPYGLDDRLCFFNCKDSSTTYATRVRWSERGNTSKFSTIGAGYQDLMDMRGIGTGAVVREFGALLFSTEEIWLQTPRRDQSAFDFTPLERSFGCPYPKTIADTPQGVIFLTRELEPYMVSGANITPIGKPVHQYLRDAVRNIDYAFGVYSSRRQRYELYFDDGSAGGRNNRGLYLDLDSGTWMPIDLHDFEISAGAEVGADQGFDFTWHSINDTWNEIGSSWNAMVGSTSRDKEVMLGGSAGTVYRLREDQMTDDGSTITAQWESHAISGEDPTKKQTLYEGWIEYKADSTGSFVLETRKDQTAVYDGTLTKSYTAQSNGEKLHAVPYVTGDHPQFRITVNDGQRPRFSRFVVKIRESGQY